MSILNHRLDLYDPKNPEPFGIADVIETKTSQSCAILALIQSEFTGESKDKLSDEIIFSALQSVYLELIDIKNIVNHYNEHNRQKKEKPDRLVT